ncbi:MAG: hypothetical protein J7L39_00740 [Candidatus Aenigmarchaeota archaeon]|nr:hypothetical protein [Candidatus Aenigmarchaeota archaeon]
MALEGAIQAAESMGIFDYYLPFALTFAIFYGLLERIKIFGKGTTARRVNLIVSVVVAFFVMAYTPFGITLKTFFSSFFAGTTVILTAGISLALISGVLIYAGGADISGIGKGNRVLFSIVLISSILVIANYITSGGLFIFPKIGIPGFPGMPGVGDIDIITIAVILITLGMVWWVVSEPKETGKPSSGQGSQS